MKNALKLTIGAAALGVSLTGVASAEAYLVWDVDKIRLIDTDIVVVKDKSLFIDVVFREKLTGAGQAHAFTNQVNAYNRVSFFGDSGALGPDDDNLLNGPDGIKGTADDLNPAGPDGVFGTDDDVYPDIPQAFTMTIRKSAETTNSFNTNSGIIQANQDTGNFVNQGNTAAISLVNGPLPDDQLPPDIPEPFTNGNAAHAEAYADQVNFDNEQWHHEETPFTGETVASVAEALEVDPADLPTEIPGNLTASIDNSFTGNSGVLHYNQNSGNFNNQQNSLAAAIGDEVFYALADAGIAQVTAFQETDDANTIKYDSITSSFNDNSGVLNVNQSTGAMNNQSTVVSVAALTSVAGIGIDTAPTN